MLNLNEILHWKEIYAQVPNHGEAQYSVSFLTLFLSSWTFNSYLFTKMFLLGYSNVSTVIPSNTPACLVALRAILFMCHGRGNPWCLLDNKELNRSGADKEDTDLPATGSWCLCIRLCKLALVHHLAASFGTKAQGHVSQSSQCPWLGSIDLL